MQQHQFTPTNFSSETSDIQASSHDVALAPTSSGSISKQDQAIIKQSLSVVLPVHNEEEIIATTLSQVLAIVTEWGNEVEVIAVNDGSTDQTAVILADFAAKDPRVRVISHPVNLGYGAALVSGFRAAAKELTFFMDSDGQFSIRDLEAFFPFLAQYDAVIGYRIDRQDTWMRKLNAWGWKMLIGFVLDVHVRDIDCAFKLYRSEFIQQQQFETQGAMINAEMLYKFKRAGYMLKEIGVHHLPRLSGRATGAHPKVILRALRDLFKYASQWRHQEQALLAESRDNRDQ
jgi:glycosyltransferase involved in cell wall biosynthesis